MSKQTLYLYRPGQKAQKLNFTSDDIPLLKKWYNEKIKRGNMPEFKDLGLQDIDNMANTVSFAAFKLNYHWDDLITCIKHDLKPLFTKIKNFF